MSNDMPNRSDSTPTSPSQTLSDRVKGRVSEARLALDHGASKAVPKPKSLRPTRPTRLARPASHLKAGSQDERDTRSLEQVYFELRATYQRYRRETGKPPVPELRDAVHAFKLGPSLTSLVSVATFLDDRGLLAW
jgi:hypothetical protein